MNSKKLRIAGLLALLHTSVAAQAILSWELVTPPSPSRRDSMGLAYDSQRGRTVLFGGFADNAALGDTWEWDGLVWTKAIGTGPAPRRFHALAYDAQRGRTVLFGGSTYGGTSTSLGDTWEWDGSTWTLASNSGPSPRSDHALAYDSQRGKTVLFGGHNGTTPLNDTWEWDGVSWTSVSSAVSPPSRFLHALTFDAAIGRVVLFGGLGVGTYFGDTWEWDGFTWLQSLSPGPPARRSHAMAFDLQRGKVVLFGGYLYNGGQVVFGDTWERTGRTWSLASTTGSLPRSDHAMAYDMQRARVLLFGGYYYENGHVGDIWEWDGAIWTLQHTAPLSRADCAMAYDSQRRLTVMLGGNSGNSTFGDTWSWNGTFWTPAIFGPNRDRHAMVYDSHRGRTVVFGGVTGGGSGIVWGDTWEFDGATWQQVATIGPPSRMSPALAFDSARNRTVLFGGYQFNGGGTTLADTWEWDGTTWIQCATTGPAARQAAAMAFDSRRGKSVLFGGMGPTGYPTDTWEWDGATWSTVATTGPPPRIWHSMAYDDQLGQTILYGGYDGLASLGDTWAWNGSAWTQLTGAMLPPRHGHAMTYDQHRHRVVLLGGHPPGAFPGGPTMDETWELVLQPTPANAQLYGVGCGSPPPSLAPHAGSRPLLGDVQLCDIVNAPFGFAAVAWGITSQSLPLDFVGINGCTLLNGAELEIGSFCPSTSFSTAQHSLAIPYNTTLLGVHVYLQAWTIAPGFNPLGIAMSNGVDLVIGDL